MSYEEGFVSAYTKCHCFDIVAYCDVIFGLCCVSVLNRIREMRNEDVIARAFVDMADRLKKAFEGDLESQEQIIEHQKRLEEILSKLEVKKDEVVDIYNNSTSEQKEVLKKVFGDFIDIRYRVKTFEDACNELGKDHVFFKEYVLCQENGCSNDLIAYLKLRIIAAALNEGWEPKFDSKEQRYYPWFNAIRGKICVPCKVDSFSGSLSRTAFTSCGHFHAFKSKELAEYAGKQFVDIYSELNGIWKLL